MELFYIVTGTIGLVAGLANGYLLTKSTTLHESNWRTVGLVGGAIAVLIALMNV